MGNLDNDHECTNILELCSEIFLLPSHARLPHFLGLISFVSMMGAWVRELISIMP